MLIDEAQNYVTASQELGDALWNVAMTARSAGVSLELVAAANIAKLRARYPDGYTDEKSLNRQS